MTNCFTPGTSGLIFIARSLNTNPNTALEIPKANKRI